MATHQNDFVLQLLLELIDDHRGDDNYSFDDHLPEVADAHHHHAISEEDNDESTDNGAGDASAPACQRGSAQHGCADGIHLKHIAGHRVGGLQLRGDNQPNKGGT